jgi:hypothetical protein
MFQSFLQRFEHLADHAPYSLVLVRDLWGFGLWARCSFRYWPRPKRVSWIERLGWALVEALVPLRFSVFLLASPGIASESWSGPWVRQRRCLGGGRLAILVATLVLHGELKADTVDCV